MTEEAQFQIESNGNKPKQRAHGGVLTCSP